MVILMIALFIPGKEVEFRIMSNDKTIHILIFFLVSLNIFYKFRYQRDRIILLFLFIVFGFLSEYIQHFIPGRYMDVRDGIADSIRICAAYIIYMVGEHRVDKLFKVIGA